MDRKVYGLITNELLTVLPQEWKQVIFYGELTEGGFSFDYYVNIEGDLFTQCFKLEEVDRGDILNTFRKIYCIILPLWKSLDKGKQWSTFTFILNRSGVFKAEFDYTNLQENAYAYYQKWRERYLK